MKQSLKNKKVIDDLFSIGKKKVLGPFLIIELESEYKGYLITASKKNFKNAVDRNRIKRLIREKLKGKTPTKAIGIVYLSKELPTNKILSYLNNI